jgi:hypothetical protein
MPFGWRYWEHFIRLINVTELDTTLPFDAGVCGELCLGLNNYISFFFQGLPRLSTLQWNATAPAANAFIPAKTPFFRNWDF